MADIDAGQIAAEAPPLIRKPLQAGFAGKGRAGFSLVEVMIAILLTAIIVLSVFSVALTAQRGVLKSEPKIVAAYVSKMLMDRLRNYVTASLELGMGPNNGAWTLPGDSCLGCTYALAPGDHDVTSLLPSTLTGSPLNMKLKYTVIDTLNTGPGPDFRPRVDVSVTWDERE